MTGSSRSQRIQTFCALCVARCGAVGVVEAGRFTRLEPDPSHPTGQALCAKGRAAPELVYSRERLTHPLRRTRPKGDVDPG
jgi:anaerobic selenocysteine-containing dehydrogenase